MSNRLQLSLILLNRFVDWFIPAEIAADRKSRKQARMFLISHLFGPFIGNMVPGALYLFDPTPGFDVAVLAASITAFWVFPFILRAGARYNILVLLSVQNLIFCILWSCYFYGGVSSPTLPWVLTIPLLAFFYLGQSSSLRLVVLGLFAANLAAFCALYLLGHSVPANDMAASALQGLGIVSTVAASLYVAMMAFYYAKILASGVELESEMKRHLATATELRRGDRRGGPRQRRQSRVPGQDEPRAAHAAQRRDRLQPDPARGRRAPKATRKAPPTSRRFTKPAIICSG